jgi:hypothetical protein
VAANHAIDVAFRPGVLITAVAGSGQFGPKADLANPGGPFAVALGDFNRDGLSDLATVNSTANSVSVRVGDGTGGFSSGRIFQPELSRSPSP